MRNVTLGHKITAGDGYDRAVPTVIHPQATVAFTFPVRTCYSVASEGR